MYQVHHHVLAEQRESLLDHIIASVSSNRQTLENAVSTKDLDKLWSRINGVCFHTSYCLLLIIIVIIAVIMYQRMDIMEQKFVAE